MTLNKDEKDIFDSGYEQGKKDGIDLVIKHLYPNEWRVIGDRIKKKLMKE